MKKNSIVNKLTNLIKHSPVGIVLKYSIFASLWILLSDQVLGILFNNSPRMMTLLSTVKGWLFVATTATLLYFLIRRQMRVIWESEKKALHMAYYNSLTGLPNKEKFREDFNSIMLVHGYTNNKAAVIYIDLDNLKSVNDSLGHNYGDAIIAEMARRLKAELLPDGEIAHIMSDEFVCLIPNIPSMQIIDEQAMRMLDTVRNPFMYEHREFYITASIGIAIYPDNGVDVDLLIKHADTALFYAKSAGKDRYKFFNEEMDKLTKERLEIASDLRRAAKNREFIVYFQPQYNTLTLHMESAEALVRWMHPTRGMVMPDSFIPIAEETGTIIEIDEYVLKYTCKKCMEWNRQYGSRVVIAVNISARHFEQESFIPSLTAIINETGMDPNLLELEITESVAIQDLEGAINKLGQLDKMGIRISLDDFGTGYSSLNYLRKLPISLLKIDRSFIRTIMENNNEAIIASEIIHMAHSINLCVVAEGVETQDQYNFLKEFKCDKIQGYLMSCPVAAEVMEELIHKVKYKEFE